MIQFLTDFFYDCLRAEKIKKEASVYVDKKKRFIDQLIVFLIVTLAFVIVGFIFDTIDSIHYLFYMFFVAVNVAYGVSIYLESKQTIVIYKLKIPVFHTIFMRVMVVLNLTSLLGLIYSFIVYSPFLGLIDQIILFVFSISTSLILIFRDHAVVNKHHDLTKNLLRIILIIPTHVFIMYGLSIRNLPLTIVVPVGVIILAFIAKYYLIPPINIEERFRLPIAVVSTFFVTLIIFTGTIFSSSIVATGPYRSGVYYFELSEEKVCDVTIDTFSSNLIIQDNHYFVQSNDTIRVYDNMCSMIETIDIVSPYLMFELVDEVALLSYIEIDEQLQEDYKAYELYIFDGRDFVKERVVYQYGNTPEPLFMYKNQLSYAVDHSYRVVDSFYIPYIQSFDEDSNYGEDHRISEDVVHYQDENRLIFQSNALHIQSKPVNSVESFLYSNGYTLFFEHYPSYENDIKPIINTVEGLLNNTDYNQLVLSKKELNLYGNFVNGFHHRNDKFYIYASGTMYVYNMKGKQINSIDLIPRNYQFVGDDLYILSDTYENTITKIDIDNPGEYYPTKHLFRGDSELYYFANSKERYKYNMHFYPVYINYAAIAILGFLLMVNVEYKQRNY